MSFLIKDDDALDKYNEICDKIKEKLDIKFHSMAAYDENTKENTKKTTETNWD